MVSPARTGSRAAGSVTRSMRNGRITWSCPTSRLKSARPSGVSPQSISQPPRAVNALTVSRPPANFFRFAGPAEEVPLPEPGEGGVLHVLGEGGAAGVRRDLQVGRQRLVVQRVLLVEDQDPRTAGGQGQPLRVGRLPRGQGVRADYEDL